MPSKSSSHLLNQCPHNHKFNPANPLAEKGTLLALIITSIMMVLEIVGGSIFNSMALLADGWHMSSHSIALGISLLAYVYARKYATHQRFSFGTWKIEVLGGYSSAILLGVVAVLMAVESIDRLLHPNPINYNPAIAIAVTGLLINLICAKLLHGAGHHDHHHSHAHDHDHDHDHDHHDLNLRSAYIHVLADALTSIFAILALLAAKYAGLNWLDPIMGIVGSVLILVWAAGLLKQTGLALLDADISPDIQSEIQQLLAQLCNDDQLQDLHVWRVGKNQYACIISLHESLSLNHQQVRQHLEQCHELVHITIEKFN